MSKYSSAKYYQKKTSFKKRLVKCIKIFLKRRKTKKKNMVLNNIKISHKIKNKCWLSIEKNIMKYGKIKPLRK